MILSILRDYWTQMLLFAQNQYQNVSFYGNKSPCGPKRAICLISNFPKKTTSFGCGSSEHDVILKWINRIRLREK